MQVLKSVCLITLLCVLAACDFFSPQPSPQGTNVPAPQGGTPTAAPNATVPGAPPASTFKPGNLFPAGLTNEPLAVVSTSPADKTEEAATTKDKARIVVQFNHPVVPLVSVSAQSSLPQPLAIQPALPGAGQWTNTSTYVFNPSQDLNAATSYSVSVKPLTDMLGQSLSAFTFSFKTAAPAIGARNPDDNTQFAGVTQPITVTFNTPMDAASVEQRFRLLPASAGANAQGVAGRFEWNATVMRFAPSQPLEFNTQYSPVLLAGAQDANKIAATKDDVRWTFRTIAKPDVASTVPVNGAQDDRQVQQGMVINFTSPMDKDSVKFTIVPSITNQYVFWQGQDKQGDEVTARISGSWQASTAYAVTVSADSRGRYGEKIGHDVVIRFKTAPLNPSVTLNVPGMMGMYDVNGAQLVYASYVNMDKVNYSLSRVDRDDLLRLIGQDSFQIWQNYRPPASNKLRDWTQSVSTAL
ncbi:MAG: hypothetical protein E6J26_03340, partial [Chloroflexi bacterium]